MASRDKISRDPYLGVQPIGIVRPLATRTSRAGAVSPFSASRMRNRSQRRVENSRGRPLQKIVGGRVLPPAYYQVEAGGAGQRPPE